MTFKFKLSVRLAVMVVVYFVLASTDALGAVQAEGTGMTSGMIRAICYVLLGLIHWPTSRG